MIAVQRERCIGWIAMVVSIIAVCAAVYFVVRGNRVRHDRRVRNEMHALVGTARALRSAHPPRASSAGAARETT